MTPALADPTALLEPPERGELSLDELERQEALVWALLEELQPLLEALDRPIGDRGAGGLRALQRMALAVARARSLLPELPAADEQERAQRIVSAADRDKIGRVAEAAELDPAGWAIGCREAGIDPAGLLSAIDRFRKAEALERVAEAIRYLCTAINAAEERIERHLASSHPPAAALAN